MLGTDLGGTAVDDVEGSAGIEGDDCSLQMKQPVIVFRAEGGITGGLGHVRRSMTLARELEKQGAKTYFIVNQGGSASGFLCRHGFEPIEVGEADDRYLGETLKHVDRWRARGVIIDSYKIRDLSCIQRSAAFTAVIDDLADRLLPVDMIINGSVNASELPYQVSPGTRLLLGANYILLREEFSGEVHHRISERVGRVMITVGGTDSEALTAKLVTWSRNALPTVSLDVVIGPFFNEDAERDIKRLAQDDPMVIPHVDPPNIRELMLKCDMAITGGGQTTYELAATGTPAVSIRLADNQSGNLQGLSAKGVLEWAGDMHDGDLEGRVIRVLRNLAEHADKRAKMSQAGRALVDGKGAARVAQAVLEACPV